MFSASFPLGAFLARVLDLAPLPGWTRWFGFALVALGYVVRVWGSSFLGRDVVYDPNVVTKNLYVAGPFRYVRNPLYVGLILLAAGLGTLGTVPAIVLLTAASTAYSYLLIAVEEPRLRATFGAEYEAYAAAVPRLLPSLVPRVSASVGSASLVAGLRAEILMAGFVAFSFAAAFVGRAQGAPFYAAVGVWVFGTLWRVLASRS